MNFFSFSSQASLQSEISGCGNQLKHLLKGDTSLALSPKKCPISATIAQWLRFQKTGTFSEIQHFLTHHPHWPREETMRKRAESELFKSPIPSDQLIAWFEKYPPLTGKGALVYIQALKKKTLPQKEKIASLLTSCSFLPADLQHFLSENKDFLTQEVLYNKAHYWVDEGQSSSLVTLLIPYLSPFQQQEIKWRLTPEKAPPLTPDSHPGLFLDQIHLKRKKGDLTGAFTLFQKLKAIPPNQASSFWGEQNSLAREFIEQKRYKDAYTILHKHQLKEGEAFANAEWLCGWVSLRFLKNPNQALEHFKKLRAKVTSPISVSRAQYWCGRTYTALGEKKLRDQSFKAAALYNNTYYGQLAHKELHGTIRKICFQKSAPSPSTKNRFEARPLIQVLHLLLSLKEITYAEIFAIKLMKQSLSKEEQNLLIDLMSQKGTLYLGVHLSKKITTNSLPLSPSAYPTLKQAMKKHPSETALIHAIIRQESRFDPNALSHAGATGLMQLMPKTAQQTAKKYKLPCHLLTHMETNISIGSRHLKDLLDHFKGSLILAIAAYNAGINPVEKWLTTFGDPRDHTVDPIDWVEMIPYHETRNYVQRVLENYYCYHQGSDLVGRKENTP